MTVKQGVRKLIIKKTLILLCLALLFGAFCYMTSDHKRISSSNNMHLIYTLVSVGVSLVALIVIAVKMRYFELLFGREWTGTVVDIKRQVLNVKNVYVMGDLDNLILIVQFDGKKRKKKVRLLGKKVSEVYFVGDRIHRLKGTRYPINLTREVEQHICPICGRNSCFGDECPDCGIKY